MGRAKSLHQEEGTELTQGHDCDYDLDEVDVHGEADDERHASWKNPDDVPPHYHQVHEGLHDASFAVGHDDVCTHSCPLFQQQNAQHLSPALLHCQPILASVAECGVYASPVHDVVQEGHVPDAGVSPLLQASWEFDLHHHAG